MLSFASGNLLGEPLQDDGLFISHLEDVTPDLIGEELSKVNDMASRTLTVPLCSTGTKAWVVESTADAQALAKSMNCSDGIFDVEWVGSIIVEETIFVVNGTVLNITGIGPIATIDGGGTTNLFDVSNGSLYLTNVNVSNGNATNGGAIEALSSELIFHRTMFSDNTADLSGGALHLSNTSTISITGESGFDNNHANAFGGAVYVGPGCSMSWSGGDMNFSNNTAGHSGGAIYVSPMSNASWGGQVTFTKNTARYNGGAVMVESDCTISWSGAAVFSDNIANRGGALHVLGASKAIWEGESLFTNNTSTNWGGALCINNGGSASWMGQSIFSDNTAYGWGGGAVAVINSNSTISWDSGKAIFSGNTAQGSYAGALAVTGVGSAASWGSNTLFSGNTATSDGGALVVRNGASASWTGETTFYNNSAVNGGAVLILLGSDVHYSGNTSFLNNSASSDGGAIMVEDSLSTLSWSGRTGFFSNAAADKGGAVLVRDGALASWSGETTFFGNSGNYGGGLFIGDGSDLQFNGDTQFKSNSARSDGGAIASYFTTPNSSASDSRSSLSINATTTIANNTSKGNGGGVALMTSVSLEVNTTSFTFHGNHAAVSGGAMFISGSEVRTTFEGTRFISNSAQLGGAIYSGVIGSEVYSTTFIGCRFVDNVAKVSGGAMYSLAGYDSFVNTSFAGNMALVGGALRLAGVSKIESCSFENNVSGEDEGPAVSNTGAMSNLANSYFEDNYFHCDTGMYREFVEEVGTSL